MSFLGCSYGLKTTQSGRARVTPVPRRQLPAWVIVRRWFLSTEDGPRNDLARGVLEIRPHLRVKESQTESIASASLANLPRNKSRSALSESIADKAACS